MDSYLGWETDVVPKKIRLLGTIRPAPDRDRDRDPSHIRPGRLTARHARTVAAATTVASRRFPNCPTPLVLRFICVFRHMVAVCNAHEPTETFARSSRESLGAAPLSHKMTTHRRHGPDPIYVLLEQIVVEGGKSNPEIR